MRCPKIDFPTLERVLWCGKVLPTPVLNHWMQRVPRPGSQTSTAIRATIASRLLHDPRHPVSRTAPIPIGGAVSPARSCSSRERHERSRRRGQRAVHRRRRTKPGYWRDEAKTRSAFVSDPRPGREHERLYRTGDLARVGSDGLFYFLGRTDSQIKSRGYRIELEEIETAINSLAEVAECAVVGIDSDGFEGTAVCCAFAAASGADVQPPALRAALSASLPSYMLPSRWKSMSALPKNVNGKIDRRCLRELFSGNPRVAAQRR